MRCPCGWTRFAEHTEVSREENATRWIPSVQASQEGLGATPLGTMLATSQGQATRWGAVVLTAVTGKRILSCDSCSYTRRSRPVGGGMVLRAWAEGPYVYTLMSDVVDPSCMEARLQAQDTSKRYAASIDLVDIALPVLEPVEETVVVLPAEAITGEVVYRVTLPEEAPEGAYLLFYFDRCLRSTQRVMEVALGGILTAYGRTNHVVAKVGDYRASQVLVEGEKTVKTELERLAAQIAALPRANGDLGVGPEGAIVVQGLQSRPVYEAEWSTPTSPPPLLRWSVARQRWEIASR